MINEPGNFRTIPSTGVSVSLKKNKVSPLYKRCGLYYKNEHKNTETISILINKNDIENNERMC